MLGLFDEVPCAELGLLAEADALGADGAELEDGPAPEELVEEPCDGLPAVELDDDEALAVLLEGIDGDRPPLLLDEETITPLLETALEELNAETLIEDIDNDTLASELDGDALEKVLSELGGELLASVDENRKADADDDVGGVGGGQPSQAPKELWHCGRRQ